MLLEILAALSDFATIAAAVLAFYLFLAKGSELRAMLRVMGNFAHQSSLGEIRQKLDALNTLRAADDQEEVVNILHDVCGQIDGNPKLRAQFAPILERIRKASSGKRSITEPQKRSLVSELRERLRHSDVINIEEAIGDETT